MKYPFPMSVLEGGVIMKVVRKWNALRSERAGAVRPAGKHFKWVG